MLAEFEEFSMYFHLIQFAEFLCGPFQRKWTRKLFFRSDELMVHMHHELGQRK